MANRRATIYMRESTIDIIGESGADGLSMRIAAMLHRYQQMCQSLLPQFTRNEWCAILDANNGSMPDALAAEGDSMPVGIWANVADSRGLDEKWNVNTKSIVKRLQKLSRAELLAVEEACVRFWNHSNLGNDEALQRAWIRPAESREQSK